MRHGYQSTAFVSLVFLFALTRGTLAQDTPRRSWTHIGAAGMTDESSAPLRFGSNGAVAVGLSVAAPARVVLRYNITAVNGLFASESDPEGLPLCLVVRYRDTGANARVVVRIKSVLFGITAEPGEHVRTLITFDSDLRGDPGTREYVTGFVCSESLSFHFYELAYFAEVELLKSGPNGDPGLLALGIELDFQ
jgi:hypothetical protein